MTGMEHAIEHAARIIRDGDPEGMGYAQAHNIASALADAGLIAPSPLHEQWAKSLFGESHRRWATDWFPVDRAEDDGRAE